jgi:MFS transporter, ACS family, solute carrier family 17 (sodium-dependent inorganic phosphate cotransporter), other
MSGETMTQADMQTAAGGRGWPARYGYIGLAFLASFICYIDRVNISVAAIAMQAQFGWSDTTKGLVLSSFFVGYMLFQIPGGWLANRIGGKAVMGAAVLWWSAFTIFTPLAAAISLPLLYLTRIAMGLGEGATFPAAYNLAGRWALPVERTRFAAMILSGVPLGTIFALLTTGSIVTRWGWPSAFFAFGLVGFAFVAVWQFWVRDDPLTHPGLSNSERDFYAAQAQTGPERVATPWRKLLRAPAVWALFVNHFCSNWTLYVLLSWLPSYFRESFGTSIVSAGLFSAAPWLSMFVMINTSAAIADRLIARGTDVTLVRKVLQIGGLLSSAGFLLLASQAATAGMALIVMCLALGALGLTWSGFACNHLDIAPRHAGVLMGITNTAGTIPGIVGVAVTGWLVDVTGSYDAPLALAAGVSVVGALVWLFFATGNRIVD